MSPSQYRARIARRLIRARGTRAVYSCDESGVGFHTIARLEAGGNKSVRLETLYLLALYYDVQLSYLLGCDRAMGRWPAGVAAWPAVDVAIRQAFRSWRLAVGIGARRLSATAKHPQVSPSWIFRIESGEVAHLDVLRLHSAMTAMGGTAAHLLPSPLRMCTDDNDDRTARDRTE